MILSITHYQVNGLSEVGVLVLNELRNLYPVVVTPQGTMGVRYHCDCHPQDLCFDVFIQPEETIKKLQNQLNNYQESILYIDANEILSPRLICSEIMAFVEKKLARQPSHLTSVWDEF